CLSTCFLNFCLGAFREAGRFHGNFLGEAAVGQNFQAIFAIADDALFDQSSSVDDCTIFKSVQAGNVNCSQRLCENVVETALRNAACQSHLATFETDTDFAA